VHVADASRARPVAAVDSPAVVDVDDAGEDVVVVVAESSSDEASLHAAVDSTTTRARARARAGSPRRTVLTRRTLMGIDRLASVSGEAGSEPPGGQHSQAQGFELYS
jgi:hypothetical protein